MIAGINKRYVGLGLILVLAVLGWWLQREEVAFDARQEVDEHVMDYAIKDFEITVMDEAGVPRHRLQAEKMIHFSDDDSAELANPYLQIYRDEGGPWELSSDVALVYQGGSLVLLQGDVHIKRQDGADSVPLTLDTRDLWVYAAQDYAESKEVVTIRDALGVTQAKGLYVDLDGGRLQLLSEVRGEYEQIN